jgi:hypothetical protein
MEIFVRRAPSLDSQTAHKWLHTVVKHEAMAVRSTRLKLVAGDVDVEREEARNQPSPDEQLDSFERVSRTAEALGRLKPHEVQAIWLKALGHSYEQICAETGWTYTKVNRCLAEGRRSFLARYAGIESGEECRRWEPMLSAVVDGEATPKQLADVRPHLRNCRACRATIRELREAAPQLNAVLPGIAMAGMATTAASRGDGGLLTRLHDAVTHHLHERAAMSALKLQAAVDAVGGSKVAAVAASAAAVAGGGAAVVERSVHDAQPPRRTATEVVREPRLSPPAASRAASVAPPAAAPSASQRSTRRGAGSPARREFGGTAPAPQAPEFETRVNAASAAKPSAAIPSPSHPRTRRPASPSGAEFGF